MKSYASSPPNMDRWPTSREIPTSPHEIFATQASHDHMSQYESEIHKRDNSDSIQVELLSLLGPDPKEASPFQRKKISKRDINSSPSSSSTRLPKTLDRIIVSNSEICDDQTRPEKLFDNKVFSKSMNSDEQKFPYFHMSNKSFNNHPIIIKNSYQQGDSLARFQSVPNQHLCIPDDQKALLENPSSWFRVETNLSNNWASIPSSVSGPLNSFLENIYAEDKKKSKNDHFQKSKINDEYYNPESTTILNLQEFPFRNSQSVPTQLFRIPANQNALLEDPNSWFRPKPNTLIIHSRIPFEVSENLSSLLCSSLPKMRGKEKNAEAFNIESDKNEKNSANQYHEFCNEDRPVQLELSCLDHVEDFNNSSNTRSPTPDVISWTDSFIEEESQEIKSQNLDNLCIPEIHEEQSRNSTNICPAGKDSQTNFYGEFKRQYPEYLGSLRDFTWALVYIEWLSLHEKCIDSKLWDDFVRVLASEYLEDVSTRQIPITGLEYYKLESHKPLYTHNFISPLNLQAALRSLDDQEVFRFRNAFQEEVSELDQIAEESPRRDLSHEPDSDTSYAAGTLNSPSKLPDDPELDEEAAKNLVCDTLNENLISQSLSLKESTHHKQVDLNNWRLFLNSRKLAGTLNPKQSASSKRYSTIQRERSKDLVD